MAIRGRKPHPVHLQLIKGNPRKHGLRDLEEKAAREAKVPWSHPEPPPDMMPEALEEWRRLIPILTATRLLSDGDRGTLGALCQTYARWLQAEKILAELRRRDLIFGGLLIKTSNGNLIQNPLVGIANTSMTAYCKMCADFGLTPSSRSRIDVPDGGPVDPDDMFFT